MFRHIDTINRYLRDMKSPIVLEIGVCEGSDTRLLLPIIHKKEGLLIGIDPGDPIYGLFEKCDSRYSKNWKLIKGRSLEVIPALDYKFDCVLIDGDHNYYVVYNELSLLKDKIAEGILFLFMMSLLVIVPLMIFTMISTRYHLNFEIGKERSILVQRMRLGIESIKNKKF